MKNSILTFILCILYVVSSAQDITINFKSKADAVSIDSIQATNLRTGQTLKLLSGESLVLSKSTSNIGVCQNISENGYLYPNPLTEKTTLTFSTLKSQNVAISIYNSTGQLIHIKMQDLSSGTHRFQLGFPISGFYHVSVLNGEKVMSFKAVYTDNQTQSASIEFVGSEINLININNQKATKSTSLFKTLVFEPGDNIHYTAYSGRNSTLISDKPIVSKTIEVEFYQCIDSDGKTYKTVQIGTQVWMAENLAYLSAVSPASMGSETEKHYYVHGYNGINVTAVKATVNFRTYGVLYNWTSALSACPTGWHLPSDAEWTILENYLITKGFNYDGTITGNKIAKAMASKTNWTAHSGSGSVGNILLTNNSSGFSALPGGERYFDFDGGFDVVGGIIGIWWSSTDFDSSRAWSRDLLYDYEDVGHGTNGKSNGYSVRCIRN